MGETARGSELDCSLMLRVREDDPAAFEQLYFRYHERVAQFFGGMAHNAATAADLTQDTFLRIWQIRKRYSAAGPFVSYLFAVARLVWLEHLRRMERENRPNLEHIQIEIETLLKSATRPRPDASAAATETRERIWSALAQLPDDQRMAFVLRTVQGLPADEVASVMQCPVNTVRSRRILAVKKLRQALGGVYSGPDTA